MLLCFLNIKHVNLFKKVEPENEQNMSPSKESVFKKKTTFHAYFSWSGVHIVVVSFIDVLNYLR